MIETDGRDALAALLDQGLSQARLARKVGVSQPAVHAWLTMRARPCARVQHALYRAYGIPLDAWLTEEEAHRAFLSSDRS